MGQICAVCCPATEESRSAYPYHKIEQQQPGVTGGEKSSDRTSVRVFNFREVERRLLSSSYIDHVAIIDLESGNILSSDFECNKEGIRNLIRAFKGRTRFIREDGIILGPHLSTYTVESMENDQAIDAVAQGETPRSSTRYGSAATSGGCSIRRTLSVVIVISYSGQGDMAKAILKQVVKDIMSDGF